MSYEPTVWETGDVVTAEKLNKLENGVANSGGGSDIPPYTSDDIGKVLTVGEVGEPVETIVVPQQSFVFDDGDVLLTAQNIGSISDGTSVIFTINGTPHEVVATGEGAAWTVSYSTGPFSNTYEIYCMDGEVYANFYDPKTGNYVIGEQTATLTALVPAAGTMWECGGVTYVNLTYDDVADDGSYISDVTVDAAIAALTAGNIVIVIVEGVKALCGNIHNSENPNPCACVNWLNFDGTNMDIFYRQFVGVSGNTWRYIGGTVSLTPET